MHPLNIDDILVTNEVLKFEKSIDIKDVHPENIPSINSTEDESKFEKSMEFKYAMFSSLSLLKK